MMGTVKYKIDAFEAVDSSVPHARNAEAGTKPKMPMMKNPSKFFGSLSDRVSGTELEMSHSCLFLQEKWQQDQPCD